MTIVNNSKIYPGDLVVLHSGNVLYCENEHADQIELLHSELFLCVGTFSEGNLYYENGIVLLDTKTNCLLRLYGNQH